ncbi:deoxyribodipyrimidine photo-lyase [Gemmobacter nectariphilus]|uniref:deoxyribodipyrimidine photo-lyase n=1 Tax=Gemmobacter nectariphilus TaxID=220343 RepID=UPI0004151FBB|nr:deoxyribodipyrimidine photo-lyase [Gemmobacter nectariphilus]
MQVVWFKRDLRSADNAALACAARVGTVLPLYVVEPDLWRQPDASYRQWAFVAETLQELRADLGRLGQPLIVRQGSVVEILAALKRHGALSALWSHEETGNDWTFQRDREVAAWCRDNGVPWHELQNHGVWRRLKSRDGWAERWDRLMAQPCAGPPQLAPVRGDPGPIPLA